MAGKIVSSEESAAPVVMVKNEWRFSLSSFLCQLIWRYRNSNNEAATIIIVNARTIEY
jgi:hypothetical protein